MNRSFSAVLLAGGQSSRMGKDKALLEIDGVPLWRRQFALLQQLQPKEIFLSGPARQEWHNITVVSDARRNVGPLGGLTSALRHCATPLLLVLAVDLPGMTGEYLRDLLASCSEREGAVPHRGGKFEPLAAVYPVTSSRIAEECLRSRNYSLQKFATECVAQALVRPVEIKTSDERLFVNLNSPHDLRTLKTS